MTSAADGAGIDVVTDFDKTSIGLTGIAMVSGLGVSVAVSTNGAGPTANNGYVWLVPDFA